MIIFIDNPDIINQIRYKFSHRTVDVVNLSSLYSGYDSVSNLITNIAGINNTAMRIPEFVNSPAFDIAYANSLMSNPTLFASIIKIMSRSFEGWVVCILVQRDMYRDAIMESLIKFIQQRYGCNAWIVEDADDIDVVTDDSLTANHIIALDNDIREYSMMVYNGFAEHTLPCINVE